MLDESEEIEKPYARKVKKIFKTSKSRVIKMYKWKVIVIFL